MILLKISKFAKHFNINKETIRYYTELKLLIPKKISNYYDYDQTCIDDMNQVLEFKSYGFNLNEISKIMAFSRLTGLIEPFQINDIINILTDKQHNLRLEILNIQKQIDNIENKITSFSKKPFNQAKSLGLPIEFLNNMECPICNKPFFISNSNIYDTHLLDATFNCECGYFYHLKNGILFKHDKNTSFKPPHMTISKDFSNLETNLIQTLKLSSTYIKSWLFKEDLNNKILLEPNSDIGLFTKDFLELLPSNSTYIVTGISYEDVFKKKKALESIKHKNKFVFIVNDKQLPFKNSIIDIILDTCALIFNFLICKNDLLLGFLSTIKPSTKLSGCYFGYKDICTSINNVDSNIKNYLIVKNFFNYLSDNGFDLTEKTLIKDIKNTGHALSFHNNSDTLEYYFYTCKFN